MKSLKFTLSAAILSCAMSAPAMADKYTPEYLHFLATKANVLTNLNEFVEIASISAGMLSAVLVLQDIGIAPRYVCPPIKDGRPNHFTVSFNLYQTIRAQNPYEFSDTDQGGALFVYTAMLRSHPCR